MPSTGDREPWRPGKYILRYRAIIGISLISVTALMGLIRIFVIMVMMMVVVVSVQVAVVEYMSLNIKKLWKP